MNGFEVASQVTQGVGQTIWGFFLLALPILLFPFLLIMARSTWLFWRQEWFKDDIKYKLYEIRIPRRITKGPKAMEQVLKAIHSLRNSAGDLDEVYYYGEVTRPFTLEIASFSGDTHFYIRTYHKLSGLITAAFASYYPDVEIVEVEDYAEKLPQDLNELQAMGYDMWGSEMILRRSPAYPIKTYHDFEVMDENKWVDPIATFLEVFGQLKEGQFVGVHFVIQPMADEWSEKHQKVVEELNQTKSKKKPDGSFDFDSFTMRTPGQTDVLKAVERNLSQPAFVTYVRFLYLSPKPTFYDSFARRGITGAFNQYATLDMNSFRQNYPVSTRTRVWQKPYIFPKLRNIIRKQRLLHTFLKRDPQPETFMGRVMTSHIVEWNTKSKPIELTAEALATLFHPPTEVVLTTPHVDRVDSRKGAPQAGLEIFGDEEEISQFQ